MDWKTLTSLGRFKDIVMVLLRYGFDDLADRLNIPGTKFMRKKSPIDQPLNTFERIRYACEERDRHQLIGLLQAVLEKDGEAMVHTLLRIGRAEAAIDQRSLERDLLDILDLHYSVECGSQDMKN